MKRTAIALVLLLAACKGDKEKSQETQKSQETPESKDTPPEPVPADAAVKVAAADAAAPAPTGPDAAPDMTGRPRYKLGPDEKVTAEVMEKLYLALAECSLVWSGFDTRTCPEKDEVHKAVWGGQERFVEGDYTKHSELTAGVAKKLLTHESPPVRYAAASDLYYKNTDEFRVLVAEMIARETDPAALRASAETFADPSMHPKLAEQALRLAEHATPEIRRAVFIRGLGRGHGIPGVFEALSAHCESDADQEARTYACRALGEIADPRAIPVFEKLLVPETDPYVYDSSLKGLIAMWTYYDNAVEDAYKKTLEIVTKGKRPPEARLSALWDLGYVSSNMKDRPDDWKAKKFVKVAAIEKALIKVASSKEEPPGLREDAVMALVQLGAKKKVFQKIRKTLPRKPEEYTPLAFLAKRVDDAIKPPAE
jgi:hypothetical protein